MSLKKTVFLLFWMFLCIQVYAQDSTGILPPDSLRAWYFYNTLDSADQEHYIYVDTVLSGVQEIDPIRKGTRFYADLGNIGQAQTNLFYLAPSSISFNYGKTAFSTFWQGFERVRYFSSLAPYTNVNYVTGPGRMQLLGLTHSQNIYRGLVLGVDFHLINAFGDYPQQKSDDYNLAVTLRYFTPNKRYGFTVAYLNDRITNQENGGITYDSLFTQNLETNRAAYAVNLADAETRWKRSGVEVFQFFNIIPPGGRKKKKEKPETTPIPKELLADTTERTKVLVDSIFQQFSDTLILDSIASSMENDLSDTIIITEEMLKIIPMKLQPIPFSSLLDVELYEQQQSFSLADSLIRADSILKIQKRIFNPGRISWRFRYFYDSYAYEDDSGETGFYDHYYQGATTYDSVRVQQMHNIFAWSNTNPEAVDQKNLFRLYLYLQHQHIKISGDVGKYEFDQLIPRAELATRIFGRFELRGEASIVSGGYNDADYMLRAHIKTLFGQKQSPIIFKGEASMMSNTAPWMYFYHNANNFMWLNSFNKTATTYIGASLAKGTNLLGVRYYLLTDLLYFNQNALPAQQDGTTGLLQAWLYSRMQLGGFHFDNQLVLQQLSNNEALHLPTFMLKSRIYFRFPLFHRALMLQPGFSIFYTSAYQAKAYMPSTNVFYLQDEQEYGNYPYIDFFVNFKVQRARLFLKYKHIAKGLFGYDYMAVPNYPLQDGGLTFGLYWRFND